MASFASSATTGGARKHAWTKKIARQNTGAGFLLHKGSLELNGDFRRRKSPLFGDFRRRKTNKAFLAHLGALNWQILAISGAGNAAFMAIFGAGFL